MERDGPGRRQSPARKGRQMTLKIMVTSSWWPRNAVNTNNKTSKEAPALRPKTICIIKAARTATTTTKKRSQSTTMRRKNTSQRMMMASTVTSQRCASSKHPGKRTSPIKQGPKRAATGTIDCPQENSRRQTRSTTVSLRKRCNRSISSAPCSSTTNKRMVKSKRLTIRMTTRPGPLIAKDNRNRTSRTEEAPASTPRVVNSINLAASATAMALTSGSAPRSA